MTEASEKPAPLLARVEQVLEAIRPAIQADGGDLELVEVTEGGEVRIRLLGACIECPSAHLTLKVGIEQNLMARIPEVTKVLAVE
jgi:Fe-S cluster biogenesis protein NfuA